MATVRKIGKKWKAEVRRKGFYKSKRFDTKLEAQAWAVELEQEINKSGAAVKGKTLDDAFDRYLKEVAPQKKGARREYNFIHRLKRDEPFTHLVLLEFDTDIINTWIDNELSRVQNSTANRYLNILSAVFEAAKKWNWIKKNPCKGARTIKSTPPRDRRISEHELNAILTQLDHQEAPPTKSYNVTRVTTSDHGITVI